MEGRSYGLEAADPAFLAVFALPIVAKGFLKHSRGTMTFPDLCFKEIVGRGVSRPRVRDLDGEGGGGLDGGIEKRGQNFFADKDVELGLSANPCLKQQIVPPAPARRSVIDKAQLLGEVANDEGPSHDADASFIPPSVSPLRAS